MSRRNDTREIHGAGTAEHTGLRPEADRTRLVRRCPTCGKQAKLYPWRSCEECDPSEPTRRAKRQEEQSS